MGARSPTVKATGREIPAAGRIVGMILLGATLIAGSGAIVGSAAATMLTRYVEPMLWGVTGSDPAVWILVGLLLGGTVIAASILPALRASRTDPALALKAE